MLGMYLVQQIADSNVISCRLIKRHRFIMILTSACFIADEHISRLPISAVTAGGGACMHSVVSPNNKSLMELT